MEKIEEGGECYRAMRAVEESAGVKMSALISAEIGGANAMEPIIAAAHGRACRWSTATAWAVPFPKCR